MAKNDRELYLKQYPEIRRWLNQCIICQTIGYKPDLPDNITPGMMAQNIRKYFTVLSVDELSICDECANTTPM